MTIQELGDIGELISSFAVVLSLISVGQQLKTSNILAQAASRENANGSFEKWCSKPVVNEELGRIWEQGIQHPDMLEPLEKSRFRWLMGEFILNQRVAYLRAVSLNHQEEQSRVERVLRLFLFTPGFQAYWPEIQTIVEPEFISFVEGLTNTEGKRIL